ncbi:hypothetical protein BpHYR1_024292 [Brachionus plicatilis]|uniref:Uncharacterized protein n=1 Tax=Brachionus plicatilis TaxID=10195 RepID=A0A3M7Q715_BRAPC|nr:hypothetical protein BpHYR1_024292 [Brachionus plicatilis]
MTNMRMNGTTVRMAMANMSRKRRAVWLDVQYLEDVWLVRLEMPFISAILSVKIAKFSQELDWYNVRRTNKYMRQFQSDFRIILV